MMRARRTLMALLACAALAAAAPAATPPARLGALPPGEAAAGFAQVLAPRTFVFPADHGPHPEYRQEWWYTTGNLAADDGERFGFELTFFRFALAPPGTSAPGDSAWRAREIYMAHFAVTDPGRGRFRFAQQLSRAALGLAGAQGAPLRVWLGDWFLVADPGEAQRWRLHAAGEGYGLDLQLDVSGAPVLNGAAGLSVKSGTAGDASYYYSLPRVAVRGQLSRAGAALPVAGLAWVDREWGSGGLGAQEVGWDWFALQLNDGTALMFYALRTATGTRDPHSAGTFTEASGVAQPLPAQAVAIEVTRTWTSAAGVRYPGAWRLRAPALTLDLEVTPLLADQELRGPPRYWEGAVEVRGTRAGRALAGRGYVELVGYRPER